jgi:uncharacterized protein DUF6627
VKELRAGFRKGLALYLCLALLILGCLPVDLMAAMIPNDFSSVGVPGVIDRAADIEKIQRVLESKIVAQRLHDLGLSAGDVQLAMAKLTPQELHDVATNLDGLQSGGEVGLIIGILVIVILVLLIIFLAKRA